jgi:hypothetical protein
MRTTDGTLQKVAVGFAEGPVNISFVSQLFLPYAELFLQKQEVSLMTK